MDMLTSYWREWRPDILRWIAAIAIFAVFAAFMVWSSRGEDYFASFEPFAWK
jgi:hypothetical protein